MVNPKTGEEIAVNENTIIPNGLRADVMRNKMENKDALQDAGDIYIGTGEKTTIEADGKTYEIPKTIGMNLIDALKVYGAITSFPLSDALVPFTLSNKEELVKTDGTLTELAKKSFAYTVGDTDIELQAKGGDKEQIIIPAWSKGMVLSNGNDLLVTYGTGEISGSFFYNQNSFYSKWVTVKTNIASILDSDTMKTTNDGLIPKTSGSVNLGSVDNSFNTIYANRYLLPGAEFNFQYNGEGTLINDALIGSKCYNKNNAPVTINTYNFKNGTKIGDNAGGYAWIKAQGIVPYSNNEVNFNIKTGKSASIEFGYQGSTARIDSYVFNNGQKDGGRSDIKCKGMEYNSYYNPDGAPLNDPTPQDISENIKSINQRLSDLGFRHGVVTANTGVNMGYNSIRRQGNYVIGEIQSVTVDTLSHAVEAFTLPDWAIPKQTDIGIDFTIPITVSNIENHIQLTVTFKRDGHIALNGVPNIPINLNFGYDIMEKPFT